MQAYLLIDRKSDETRYMSDNDIAIAVAAFKRRESSLTALQLLQASCEYGKKLESI